ncbi:MAG: hypothetical protein QXN14_03035 [Ignisphaera sp.]
MILEKVKHGFLLFYPAIYGPCLLYIFSYIVNSYINNTLDMFFKTGIWSRVINILVFLSMNIEYTVLLLILIFVETLRISIINTRALLLFESMLLILYLWSIEVVLIYIVMSYVLLKLADKCVYSHNNHLCLSLSRECNSEPKSRGLIILILGICIGVHILYSYIISVNIVTVAIYATIMSICYRLSCISKNHGVEILLSAIPPFGVIIPWYTKECEKPLRSKKVGLESHEMY